MKKLLHFLTAVALFFTAVCLSVIVTLNCRPLYYHDIDALDIPSDSGLDEAEIRKNYDALIDYNSPFFSGELELPSMKMSEEGRIHFVEVRNIFCAIWLIFAVGTVVSAVLIYFLRKEKPWYLLVSSVVSLAVPAAVGIFIAVDWEKAFILMHKVLFRNDFWSFNPLTDPVIWILPSEYFMHCGVMIVSLILFFAVAAFVLFFVFAGRRKRKPEPESAEITDTVSVLGE